MQYAALLALAASAALVSSEKVYSATYKAEVEVYEKYDCDATASKCYHPQSYGGGYKAEKYSYKRQYAYPGPKERFMNKLKKIAGAISAIVKKVIKGFKHTWLKFAEKFNTFCAVVKSDLQRFEDWKTCQADKFKDWWEYHHDLCRTRKQLYDDAMREFYRQWTHYKHTRREEYEARKKACGITEKDYDDEPEYKEKVNKYGVAPAEDQYNKYTETKKYDPAAYKKHCEERDAKYKK